LSLKENLRRRKMAQSITLTASMRSNLASLKSIQSQMDTTQERLSTGKKVNSAIDNASSFYQSRALTNRAADLDSLLDSMGQGIQTIQAANEGIEAITSYIEQAKSVANSAFALDVNAEDYGTQLGNYQKQFNAIVKEIGTLANDASYQGVNLLKDGELTVMFNETRTHSLTINGDDVMTEMANVGFAKVSWAGTEDATGKTALEKASDALTKAKTDLTEAEAGITATKVATPSDTNIATYYELVDGKYVDSTDTSVQTGKTYYTLVDAKTDGITNYNNAVTALGTAQTNYTTAKNAIGDARQAVNTTLNNIAKATEYLRDYSSELGNNFSIIETRQDFTEALVDVLETGSDNLVLADMNEESANYLALQTRQQLAINSLSFASQSAQSVLSLF
jgi:flagellin-like hook-associated protein FlgL